MPEYSAPSLFAGSPLRRDWEFTSWAAAFKRIDPKSKKKQEVTSQDTNLASHLTRVFRSLFRESFKSFFRNTIESRLHWNTAMKKKWDTPTTLPRMPAVKSGIINNRNWIVTSVLFLNSFVLHAFNAAEAHAEKEETGSTLTEREKKQVKEAISGGVKYLRSGQNSSGSWIEGNLVLDFKVSGSVNPRTWPVGYAALPALTLLECGISKDDPGIAQAAKIVRFHSGRLIRTYEISLAILLLDKMGSPVDRPIIRSLAIRLIASQTRSGGWSYNCPMLSPKQELTLLELLKSREFTDGQKAFSADHPKPKGSRPAILDKSDNSNTQFAILALWAARKHGVPMSFVFGMTEARFRATQQPGGWSYVSRGGRAYGSMACVGLLALAAGRASIEEAPPRKVDEAKKPGEDAGLVFGLRALAVYLQDPRDSLSPYATVSVPKGAVNLYFLWSVERVGVFCNLDTIGGRDWYRWGAEMILATQRPDGSWSNGGGGSPVIDTCFALLFLKRSDLLPGLRETLQKRITIVDPGIDGKGVPPTKKSPGEKSSSPGEKGAQLDGSGDRLRQLTPSVSPPICWTDHCSGRFWISSRNSAGV